MVRVGRRAAARRWYALRLQPTHGIAGGQPEVPMGLLERVHAHHARHVAEVAENHYEAAFAEWQEAEAHLAGLLQVAKDFGGQTAADNPNLALSLKRNEHAFFTLSGAGLVEARRGPGHWVGGYSGFSFRVAKGVRYHIGGTRGHYIEGQE